MKLKHAGASKGCDIASPSAASAASGVAQWGHISFCVAKIISFEPMKIFKKLKSS